VRIHLAEGNVAEALRAYGTFATMLAEEFGVPPTGHMTRLLAGHLRGPGEWAAVR
jgi:DNA-binding SARP family transcriptional activator